MPKPNNTRMIETWNMKWPRRQAGVSMSRFLGEDTFGRWLGTTAGDSWQTEDRSHSGVFLSSFVILIPRNAYWTACFNSSDSIIDVDIVMPVQWTDTRIEIIDLELDVLQSTDGAVTVRDQDEFAHIRAAWNMPNDIAEHAESACDEIRLRLEQNAEPFRSVGAAWLSCFLRDSRPN